MLANYNELKDAVAKWLRRDNLQADIPTLIRLGEQQLMMELKVPEMIMRTFVGVGAGSDIVALPQNCIAIRSLFDGEKILLNKTTANMMNDQRNDSGTPAYYSVHGSNLLVRPIPNNVVSLQLEYWGFPQFLSDNNQANVILTKYPSLYLYSALIFGYDIVRHAEQRQAALVIYNQQKDLANNAAHDLLNRAPQASPQRTKGRYVP
jgi:hypothetical protein